MSVRNIGNYINNIIKKSNEIKQRIKISLLADFICDELDDWSRLFLLLSKDIKNKKSERRIIDTAALCATAITNDYFEYFWFRSFQDGIQIYEKKVNDKIQSLDRSYEDYPLDTLISLGESNELLVIINYINSLKIELYSS